MHHVFFTPKRYQPYTSKRGGCSRSSSGLGGSRLGSSAGAGGTEEDEGQCHRAHNTESRISWVKWNLGNKVVATWHAICAVESMRRVFVVSRWWRWVGDESAEVTSVGEYCHILSHLHSNSDPWPVPVKTHIHMCGCGFWWVWAQVALKNPRVAYEIP